jgi:hypothetical protein
VNLFCKTFFIWARRQLNSPFPRFLARAAASTAGIGNVMDAAGDGEDSDDFDDDDGDGDDDRGGGGGGSGSAKL